MQHNHPPVGPCALNGTHNAAETRLIPITRLYADDNTRLARDPAHLDALEADIRQRLRDFPNECPITTPLRVLPRGERFLILGGVNRFAVSLRIPLETLPCNILPHDLDAMGVFIEQFRDNALRQDYNPPEKARALLHVRNGPPPCSLAEAGRKLGILAPEATKLAGILKHPDDLLAKVGEGEGRVPFTTAYHLSRLWPDEQKVRELFAKAEAGLLVRDDAEALVSGILGGKKRKVKPLKLVEAGAKLEVPSDWSLERIQEALAAFVAKVKKAARNELQPNTIPEL